jgi:hypothetical protein
MRRSARPITEFPIPDQKSTIEASTHAILTLATQIQRHFKDKQPILSKVYNDLAQSLVLCLCTENNRDVHRLLCWFYNLNNEASKQSKEDYEIRKKTADEYGLIVSSYGGVIDSKEKFKLLLDKNMRIRNLGDRRIVLKIGLKLFSNDIQLINRICRFIDIPSQSWFTGTCLESTSNRNTVDHARVASDTTTLSNTVQQHNQEQIKNEEDAKQLLRSPDDNNYRRFRISFADLGYITPPREVLALLFSLIYFPVH